MTIAMLVLSILINAALIVAVRAMAINHFGTFSSVATRAILKFISWLRLPVSVVVYDIRKMHEMNSAFGYEESNNLVASLTRHHDRRDFVGQWGGDEFVIVSAPHAGVHIAARIVNAAMRITGEMPIEKRSELATRTRDIIDGLHVAITSCDLTRNAYRTAGLLVDETEHLKEHGATLTGNRATTGNKGTLVSTLN